ncbi:putative UPF0577 like protein [Blattamonas nauphoetae]|uniref:UPF0577 like protein n=1 Tax=Blattamonas nauphoetae TaxID=2049346 RepID=A0ABQ9YB92_9EUKA|nr:putative UPF0577 like protein [Blattamonas nauphoetae]
MIVLAFVLLFSKTVNCDVSQSIRGLIRQYPELRPWFPSVNHRFSSNSSPYLSRPFFDTSKTVFNATDFISSNDGEECTDRDIIALYSNCVDKKRAVAFVYKSGCTPPNPDNILPPPIVGQSCNLICGKGQYYGKNESFGCHICPVGKYASGTSILYENWTEDKKKFTQTSSNLDIEWEVKENYITSGVVQARTKKTLSTEVTIFMEEGRVSFDFYSPKTLFDYGYASFTIDGQTVSELTTNKSSKQLIANSWTTVTYDLSFGKHTLAWTYEVTDFSSVDVSLAIRRVEITGTVGLVTSCSTCEKGFYSENGIKITCPSGSSCDDGTITQCEAGKMSPPGSSRCYTLSKCTPDDYHIDFTGTPKYVLRNDSLCDAEGVTPPTIPTSDNKCNPGMYRQGGTCVKCPKGTYRSGDMADDKCLDCKAGYRATPSTIYSSFTDKELDGKKLQTFCVSNNPYDTKNEACATKGFEPKMTSLYSGTNHFGPVTVGLRINLKEFGEGVRTSDLFQPIFDSISINFRTNMKSDSYLHFATSTDNPVVVNSMSQRIGDDIAEQEILIPLFEGDEEILILWKKDESSRYPSFTRDESDHLVRDDQYVEITQIDLASATNGTHGASQCTECPSGTYAEKNSDVCTVCPPGTFASSNGSSTCAKCEDGSYADQKGSIKCRKCGDHTTMAEDRASCINNAGLCGFKAEDGRIINLEPLMAKPVTIARNTFTKPASYRWKHSRKSNAVTEPWSLPIGNTSDTLLFNLCSEDFSDDFCVNFDRTVVKAPVCVKTVWNTSYAVGKVVDWEPWGIVKEPREEEEKKLDVLESDTARISPILERLRPITSAFSRTDRASNTQTTAYGLQLNYLDGEPCYYYDESSGQLLNKPYTTHINFTCQPDEPIDSKPTPAHELGDDCSYRLNWKTPYACMPCMERDWEEAVGVCVNGEQNVVVLRDSKKLCVGGYNGILEYGKVHNKTDGTPLDIPADYADLTQYVYTVSCPRVARLGIVPVIIFCVCFVIALAVVIVIVVVLCRKNRKLKFQLFQKSNVDIYTDDIGGQSHRMHGEELEPFEEANEEQGGFRREPQVELRNEEQDKEPTSSV